MTSVSTPSPAALPHRTAAHAAAPVPVATLDPLKLAVKYRWWLGGALFGGLAIGVVAHFVLMFAYPVWRASVLFECFSVLTNIDQPIGSQPEGDQALDRFMQTQAKMMTSDIVLLRVAEDPRLEKFAPRWSAYYKQRDGSINSSEALLDLQDDVSSRVVAQTRLIELSMSYRDKTEVTAIMRLVREAYQAVIREQVSRSTREQRDAVLGAITDLTDKILTTQTRRERIMTEGNVDIINRQQLPATAEELRQINQQLVTLNMDIDALKVRLASYEDQLSNPGGIDYPSQLRDMVEQESLLLNLKGAINQLESDRKSLSLRFKPEHRSLIDNDRQLAGYSQQLKTEREALLRQRFDGEVDSVRKAFMQMQAQQIELIGKKEIAQGRMTQLSRIQSQLDDLDSQVKQNIDSRSKMEFTLQNLGALSDLDANKRVIVAVSEREPSEVAFPKLKVMMPAGGVLVFGLVLGVLVLRELVDQRVKGPSDVALIPKARVVGMVPDASEDPAGSSAVETSFRDRERGVMAESFRQIRAGLLKRMNQMDQKTLLVVSGMPGSGATSVISNLAYSFAAADRRVLVIDANLRRPAHHRIFGLPEAPGLADVLAGTHTLDNTVQRSADRRVDVLVAGTRENRVFERLSTDAMSAVLRRAREQYDLVLIDAAPMVVSGDALGLATRCDASLLVIRALSEKRGMVARLRNELAEAKADLLGVLVNGVKSAAGGYLKGNIKATHDYQTKDAA